MSPGRVNITELHAATRRKVVGQAEPTPRARRSTRAAVPASDGAGRWFCLTCGLRSDSEAAAARHAAAVRHYRYTDLGLGL